MKGYRGISYPAILGRWPIFNLWKKFMCPRNYHLFDECLSDDDHYLVCDACDLSIVIERIEERVK